MPDAAGLLGVARGLLAAAPPGQEGEAALRRAVSTAYYALFHLLLRAAADRFLGAEERGSVAYTLLYRAFDHGRMRQACAALNAPNLGRPWRDALRRSAASDGLRDLASSFLTLQAARHLADYDPSATFLASDAESLVDAAEGAMTAFATLADPDRTDLLALLLAPPRG